MGRAEEKLALRAETLLAAFDQHRNRFVGGVPSPGQIPKEVAINPIPTLPLHNHQHGATPLEEVTK